MHLKHELVIYLNYYDASYKCQSQKSSVISILLSLYYIPYVITMYFAIL